MPDAPAWNHEDILHFWFEEIEPRQWWADDPGFDAMLRERYGELHEAASHGELEPWRRASADGRGRLAEIIVLDQFSRNMYRDTPRSFAQDVMALVLAQEAVACSVHLHLPPDQATFLLMPFMHSESRVIHLRAEALFAQFTPEGNYRFELAHKAIIDRFGRYPHRNAILGRASSAEELGFLKQPGSKF